MEKYYHRPGQIDDIAHVHQGYLKQFGGKNIDLGTREERTIGSLSEHQVDYKGNRVLVCAFEGTRDGRATSYSNVPGRVVSTVGRVSQVEPITDKTERQELTDLIRAMGIEGPINFREADNPPLDQEIAKNSFEGALFAAGVNPNDYKQWGLGE